MIAVIRQMEDTLNQGWLDIPTGKRGFHGTTTEASNC